MSSVITGWNGATLTATVWPPLPVIPSNSDFLTIVHNLGGTVNVGAWNGAAVLALPTNFTLLAIDGSGGVTVGAVEAAASNIKKNQALSNFKFVMTNAVTRLPQTGLHVTSTRDIDGNGFGPCANGATEVGSGWYSINLAASDMNGNVIALRFTAPSAADTNMSLITQP